MCGSAVMKWAVAQGHRNDNPAGDAIRVALPQHWAHREHQRALAHSDVAGTLRTIRDTGVVNSDRLASSIMGKRTRSSRAMGKLPLAMSHPLACSVTGIVCPFLAQ